MISTKGRYALRVMVALAENRTDGYVSLKKIAEEEVIPHKYLESIMTALAKAALVEGSRGKSGGYRLSRPPERYTVLEILQTTETSLSSVSCTENGGNGCRRADGCPTLPMWRELDKTVKEFFSAYSLADLVKGKRGGKD